MGDQLTLEDFIFNNKFFTLEELKNKEFIFDTLVDANKQTGIRP